MLGRFYERSNPSIAGRYRRRIHRRGARLALGEEPYGYPAARRPAGPRGRGCAVRGSGRCGPGGDGLGAELAVLDQKLPSFSKTSMNKKCEICGDDFKSFPSLEKRGVGRFCSKKCQNIWQSKYRLKDLSPGWDGGPEKVKCTWCGKVVEIKKSRIKAGKNNFCSTKCRGLWRSKNIKGKESPGWKGGVTPVQRVLRNSDKYLLWRSKVFKRDNYTCQKCKNIGGKLHAHHIRKFSIILNDLAQNYPLLSVIDLAEQCRELWDIWNGITLCEKCHKKEHRRNNACNKKNEQL